MIKQIIYLLIIILILVIIVIKVQYYFKTVEEFSKYGLTCNPCTICEDSGTIKISDCSKTSDTICANIYSPIYVCGTNTDGQLGTGTYDNVDNINEISFQINVKQIANTNDITYILSEMGQVYCCGYDKTFNLTKINYFDNIIITQVSCTYRHALFLSDQGTIYFEGEARKGSKGNGQEVNSDHDDPIPLNNIITNNPIISYVHAGRNTSYVITESGELYATGDNGDGELGLGLDDNNVYYFTRNDTLSSSTDPVVEIENSDFGTLFLTQSGNVYGCGWNSDDRFGLGSMTMGNAVRTATRIDWFHNNGISIKQLSSCKYHSLFITAEGAIYACGRCQNGSLPPPTQDDNIYSVPFECYPIPGEKVIKVKCGYNFSLFLTESGNVYGIGNNNKGQLGLTLGNIYREYTLIPTISKPIKDIQVGNLQNVENSIFIGSNKYVTITGTDCIAEFYQDTQDASICKKCTICEDLGNFHITDCTTTSDTICGDLLSYLDTSLVLWLDGKDIDKENNTTLNHGDSITTWRDKSNYGINTSSSESYGLSRPIINKYESCLYFTNGNYFRTDVSINNYERPNIFIVWKPEDTSSEMYLWGSVQDRDFIINRGNWWYGQNESWFENNIYIVNCEYNIDNQNGKLYINNELIETPTFPTPTPALDWMTFGSRSYWLEWRKEYMTNSITGNIYEIIIIDRQLTDNERTSIYNYLNNKWDRVQGVVCQPGFYKDNLICNPCTICENLGKNKISDCTNISDTVCSNFSDLLSYLDISLVLWHDAKNIDGTNNNSLNIGDTVTTWNNLSGSSFTTSNGASTAPTYNGTGLFFNGANSYSSTINLNNYSTMNIFIVWKPNAHHTNTRWLWSQDNHGFDRTLIMYANSSSGTIHYVGAGDGDTGISNFNFIPNNIFIVNCEYNTDGNTGRFYVNNDLDTSFISLSPNGTTNTFFGAKDASASNSQSGHPRGITGDIYEIIIIDRLITSSERTSIYDYLNYKWMVEGGGGEEEEEAEEVEEAEEAEEVEEAEEAEVICGTGSYKDRITGTCVECMQSCGGDRYRVKDTCSGDSDYQCEDYSDNCPGWDYRSSFGHNGDCIRCKRAWSGTPYMHRHSGTPDDVQC